MISEATRHAAVLIAKELNAASKAQGQPANTKLSAVETLLIDEKIQPGPALYGRESKTSQELPPQTTTPVKERGKENNNAK